VFALTHASRRTVCQLWRDGADSNAPVGCAQAVVTQYDHYGMKYGHTVWPWVHGVALCSFTGWYAMYENKAEHAARRRLERIYGHLPHPGDAMHCDAPKPKGWF
jgi:hypothetical protein